MTKPLSFSACLHPYFKFKNTKNISLRGLNNLEYIDKVDGRKKKVENLKYFKIEEASTSSGEVKEGNVLGYIDRIYSSPTTHTLVLIDNNDDRDEVLVFEKSIEWPDYVIFNPWIEGKKDSKGPDFDNDGYRYMLCVEPAIGVNNITLKKNESWNSKYKITIVN